MSAEGRELANRVLKRWATDHASMAKFSENLAMLT
eukprot:SAG11_NODE_1259_length_5357_cov_34.538227_8_plen_35_part_00